MNNSSNAPERDGKGAPNDADDSGDEDVFHDAHFPAEEEAVSRNSVQAYDRSRILTSIFPVIATTEGSSRNQIRGKSAIPREKL